jgi:hypothetical protein
LHSTKWSNGKKKEGGKPHSSKNDSIQDSLGNEENGYPVPYKRMINVTKEPSDTHKKPSKRKSLKKTLRNSWRRYLTWLNRMCKMHSRNFKTPKTRNMRRHRNKSTN